MWVLELLGIAVFGISVITSVANTMYIKILFDEIYDIRKEVREHDQNS